MDKLMFWKKNDEFGDLGTDFGKSDSLGMGNDLGLGNEPGSQNNMGFSKDDFGGSQELPGTASLPQINNNTPPPTFGARQRPGMPALEPVENNNYANTNYSAQQNNNIGKEIEIISVKLDNIRNTLEILNQRITRIERIAESEQQGERRWN